MLCQLTFMAQSLPRDELNFASLTLYVYIDWHNQKERIAFSLNSFPFVFVIAVLGMLAVQVERDPKTGATIVRSVAPVSSPAGAPKATTVFDDGRKSIHTIGGSVNQPSNEELSQILHVIDGVGMEMLLDESTITSNTAEMTAQNVKTSTPPEEKALLFNTYDAISKESHLLLESCGNNHLEAEIKMETCAVSIRNTDNETMMVRSNEEKMENIENQKLEEDPVTLVFLGYTDDTADHDHTQEDEGMLTVERVIITEDGEEQVLGEEVSASLQSPLEEGAEQEAAEDAPDKTFSVIPVDGSGAEVKAQGQEGDNGKHKTCQCCTIM